MFSLIYRRFLLIGGNNGSKQEAPHRHMLNHVPSQLDAAVLIIAQLTFYKAIGKISGIGISNPIYGLENRRG